MPSKSRVPARPAWPSVCTQLRSELAWRLPSRMRAYNGEHDFEASASSFVRKHPSAGTSPMRPAPTSNDRLRPHRYTHPLWPDPPLLIMSPCAAVAGCLKAATNRFGSAEQCMAWRRDKDLLQTSLAEYMRRHTVRAIAEAKRAHPKRTISPGPECGTRDAGVGVDQQSGGSGLQFSPLRLAVAPNFDMCPVQPDP